MLKGRIKKIEFKQLLVDAPSYRIMENLVNYHTLRVLTHFPLPKDFMKLMYPAALLNFNCEVSFGFAQHLVFDGQIYGADIFTLFQPLGVCSAECTPDDLPNYNQRKNKDISDINSLDDSYKVLGKKLVEDYLKNFEFGIGDDLWTGLRLTLVDPSIRKITKWPKRVVIEFKLTNNKHTIFNMTAQLSYENINQLFGQQIPSESPETFLKTINGKDMILEVAWKVTH